MKKSKLSVGLVASFIGALAMSACSSTTSKLSEKDGSLVELEGYNGEKIEVRTDDLYNKYGDSKDGTKLYYDAILEALIRYEYPKLSQELGSTLKKFSDLESEVTYKIENAKDKANQNATDNSTSYDEEWDKILESYDCENEEDLRQYYLYNLEKEELSDWYAKTNIDALKEEFIGLDENWDAVAPTNDVDAVFPYHILHVLVTLSDGKDNYNRGTISEDEATKLWQVVRLLLDGDTKFEDVAAALSDDPGSKAKYGDVGIMSTKTSFYNEFKLGIYAYDAILSNVNTENASTESIYKAFGLDSEATVITKTTAAGGEAGLVKEKVADLIKEEMVDDVSTPVSRGLAAGKYANIPTVPYDVFRQIGKVAKLDQIGAVSPESGSIALPRNVLYNQFLNFHSPFVITNEDIKDTSVIASDEVTEDKVLTAVHDFASTGTSTVNTEDVLKIEHVNFNSNGVLTDRSGNIVIGVRSEAGIHFMVMRKSVFKGTNALVGKDNQSLEDYYTTLVPSDENFPAGETYVNMKATDDQTYYKDRANEIKDELKSTNFDSAYDYRLYEYLTNNELFKDKIKYCNDKIEQNIDEYISLLRETSRLSNTESINNSWKSYLMQLRYQNTVRNDFTNSLIPTTCAFRFDSDHAKDFEKGGICYVVTK